MNWFVHRAIEEVTSWDGSASNYADTNAYCKACLIDVNPAGKAKAQSHCMLPVKAPGSSKFADRGIMAASGGHGLSQVKKPSDVDQTTWDAVIKKAAKTIVNAYKDMGRKAPGSMMDMAGMARAVSVDSIFQQLQTAMYEGMDSWSGMDRGELGYLVTVYIENGELYALFNKEGLLRRSLLNLGDNDVVTMGPLEDVSQQFVPTQRSQVTIKRQVDGNYRIFMLAATALINKEGQIDSTKLFDNMIQRAEDYGFWPTIDFAHLGEEDESCEFGEVDWLGREGVCYLASGVLYADHPITQALVPALQQRATDWGVSIEYYPVPDSVDYLNLGEIEIPVFLEGLNTRITILPAEDACSWFTNIGLEQRSMNAKQKAALIKLLGEEEFNRRMADVGSVNTETDKRKLIFRTTSGDEGTANGEPTVEASATEQQAETPAEEPVNDNKVDANLQPEIELDDEAVAQIAQAVADAPSFSAVVTALTEKLTNLLEQFTALQTNFNTMQTAVTRMDSRIQGLENEEQVYQQVLNADKPRRVNDAKVRMVYRPRDQHQAEQRSVEDEELDAESFEDIANKTLERIPNNGYYPA